MVAAFADGAASADGKVSIVIIGGGIIGCTTAYYLTRHPAYSPEKHSITLIEKTRLAGGASGKAGGLLAQWAYPSCLVSLSYSLHAELAAAHDGTRSWGYRRIRCGKITVQDHNRNDSGGMAPLSRVMEQLANWVPLGKTREVSREANKISAASIPEDLDWFRRDSIHQYEDIAPKKATAQVHPYQFTLMMAKLAADKGVKIVFGGVDSIEYVEDTSITTADTQTPQKVRSVHYTKRGTRDNESISADFVIVAAGPWTPQLFPFVPMNALRAHSVTIKPSRPISAYCLFTEIPASYNFSAAASGATPEIILCPEVYSRPNNEVYIAGSGDDRVPLPPSTDEVEVDREACQQIEDALVGVSDELRCGTVTGRRACYLPTVDLPAGNPLVGPTWIQGLVLATGHSCWGIHNAPATGKLVSEMVFEGTPKSADISILDPRLVI